MNNILLCTVDCLRYDRCGFNGHYRPTTPTLDKLANESLIFDHAYTTGPYTTESVPGIIAGQHSYNGSYFGDNPAWKALNPDDETLATYLQANEYETVATLSNPHLTQARNFDRGFNRFQNLRTRGTDQGDNDESVEGKWASQMYDFRDKMRSHSSLVNRYTLPFILYRYQQSITGWPTIDGKEIVKEFVKQISDQDVSSPFFGWTHFMDLHAPIHPDRVKEGGLAAREANFQQFLWDAARAARIHEPRYDTLYDSALRYVDQQISTLIDELKKRDVWDETILIVTGDHGEVLFDRYDIYGHPRHHLYDELLHVPLLIRTPSEGYQRINHAFSLAWLHELISELLDLPTGNFVARTAKKWTKEASQTEEYTVVSDTIDNSGHSVTVRNNSQKVIHHQSRSTSDLDTAYPYLRDPVRFDYRVDPGERNPSPAVGGLRTEAESLLTFADELTAVRGKFDEKMEQRLQDLGYKM